VTALVVVSTDRHKIGERERIATSAQVFDVVTVLGQPAALAAVLELERAERLVE
jgi:hypothetical protein